MNVSLADTVREPELRVSFDGSSVSLRGITKSFGVQEVLHGIDLDIPAGQFVAIVGRSGCGKSTLLRLVAGLDKPTSGTIEIDGRASGWGDTVRLMFQEPRLLPWQRVAANVEVGLSHRKAGEDRRRLANETLAQVGLDKGFTAIVVTHDVTEAVTRADRVLLLDSGRVAMDVTVDLPRPRRH